MVWWWNWSRNGWESYLAVQSLLDGRQTILHIYTWGKNWFWMCTAWKESFFIQSSFMDIARCWSGNICNFIKVLQKWRTQKGSVGYRRIYLINSYAVWSILGRVFWWIRWSWRLSSKWAEESPWICSHANKIIDIIGRWICIRWFIK